MDRTAAAEIGAPTGSPYERRWLALLVLSLSLVVIGLDNTILNVALPTIARSLHASGSQLQWMVDAYVLVFAGLLLTMGAASDRFGRKAALNAGLSIFLLTQHLQFVLGYTPLEAGFRVLPIGVLIVAAPLSATLVEHLGTKVVVAGGLLIVAGGLGLLSTVDVGTGYGRVGLCVAILGWGMGFTMAPATDAVMGALPLAKAGVGSAMNDTTRQIGGALGVAVMGSVLSSGYGSAVRPFLRSLPSPAAAVAGDSIGAATGVAARLGGAPGAALLAGARSAYVHGMDAALMVAVGVALTGAVVVLLFLPARGGPVPE